MRFAPQHYYHVVHFCTKSTFVSLSISSAPFTVSQLPPSLPLASLPPSLFPFRTLALASLPLTPFISPALPLSPPSSHFLHPSLLFLFIPLSSLSSSLSLSPCSDLRWKFPKLKITSLPAHTQYSLGLRREQRQPGG